MDRGMDKAERAERRYEEQDGPMSKIKTPELTIQTRMSELEGGLKYQSEILNQLVELLDPILRYDGMADSVGEDVPSGESPLEGRLRDANRFLDANTTRINRLMARVNL